MAEDSEKDFEGMKNMGDMEDSEPKKKKKQETEEQETQKEEGLENENAELKEKLDSMGKILEKIGEGGNDSGKPSGDMTGEISQMKTVLEEIKKEAPSEKFSNKLKKSVDKFKEDTAEKMAEIEKSMKDLADKLDSRTPVQQPAAGGQEVSSGLASFGGSMDVKSEFVEIRGAIKDVNRRLDEIKEATDISVSRIRERIKVLDRIPEIDDRLDNLIDKMGPDNIEKMRKMVLSIDDLTSQTIPQVVHKKVDAEITPYLSDIKASKEELRNFSNKTEDIFKELAFFKGEIRKLYKFGDYISTLDSEKTKTREIIKEREAKLLEKISALAAQIKALSRETSDNLKNFEKSFSQEIEDKVKHMFFDLSETRLSELEDKFVKELVGSREYVEEQSSRLSQFENFVNPVIKLTSKQIEDISDSMEKMKDELDAIDERVEDEVKEEFKDEVLPHIVEAKKEFNDVADALEKRIKELKEDAGKSTKSLQEDIAKLEKHVDLLEDSKNKFSESHKASAERMKAQHERLLSFRKSLERVNALAESLKAAEKSQEALKARMEAMEKANAGMKLQFESAVKQSLMDRRKMAEDYKKQKQRINVLLSELGGK